MALATDAYRTCYSDCRAQGGTIAACMSSCEGLIPGDACDPCCGLWNCFAQELPNTVQDVTGGIYQYGLQPLTRTAWGIAAAAVAVVVLIAVLRP